MNPNPLSALNHLTVPVANLSPPSRVMNGHEGALRHHLTRSICRAECKPRRAPTAGRASPNVMFRRPAGGRPVPDGPPPAFGHPTRDEAILVAWRPPNVNVSFTRRSFPLALFGTTNDVVAMPLLNDAVCGIAFPATAALQTSLPLPSNAPVSL